MRRIAFAAAAPAVLGCSGSWTAIENAALGRYPVDARTGRIARTPVAAID